MRKNRNKPTSNETAPWHAHEQTILVLQGGGALGAYQAGVYEGLADLGLAPDWVTGVSIGAINSTLIAGNPPERRVARLREFWERMSTQVPFVLPPSFDMPRPVMNRMSAASAALFGVQGFFTPRILPPFMATEGTSAALSYYDTSPLKDTLLQLADFDLINKGPVRLSLGAVNIRTAQSMYFDSKHTTITADHVLASGALPPGFPPIEIDGELYWDGGIVSNTPLHYVLDENFRIDAFVVQVDVFNGIGKVPRNMLQVQERAKDIQYASKQRLSTARLREIEELRTTLAKVLSKLPQALRADPDVQRLAAVSTRGALSVAHLVNRHDTRSSSVKDCEFSRATVTDLWAGGLADVRRMIADPSARTRTDFGNNVHSYMLND